MSTLGKRTSLGLVLVATAGLFYYLGSMPGPEAETVDKKSSSHGAGRMQADTTMLSGSRGGLAAADKDGDGIVYQDGMHPWIVLDEPGPSPDCGMELTPVRVDETGDEGTVRISPATLQNIGVRTTRVTIEPLNHTFRTTGRIRMDEQGQQTVSLKVSGWIETLHADYNGAIVKKGEPLLDLYSPELVSTQEEYLLAFQNARRLEGTMGVEDATGLLRATRRRLEYWDISQEQIERLEEAGTPQRTVTFYAPSSGEVMRKGVSQGEFVEAGETLMEIVDISRNWLIVDVYEQDLAWVKVGTPARVELPFRPGVSYDARVDYIYHMLDTGTRSAEARVTLPGGHRAPIKPGMFATVYLSGQETDPGPVVPEEAVIRTGTEALVVLALGEGRFRPIAVETGLTSGGKTQILAGLAGGETVVTSAQFLIDSEARLQNTISAMIGAAPVDEGGAAAAGEQPGLPPVIPQEPDTQVVEVKVGETFEPEELELEAGVPARLVFTRTTDATCAKTVQIPDFGIEKTELPLNQPVAIELTPPEKGSFTFACGMDMLSGLILVR